MSNQELIKKVCDTPNCATTLTALVKGRGRMSLFANHSDADAAARREGWYVDAWIDRCRTCVAKTEESEAGES